MRNPLLFGPLALAIALIVVGRVYRRQPWGNPVAIIGYAVLAVTIVVGIAVRG